MRFFWTKKSETKEIHIINTFATTYLNAIQLQQIHQTKDKNLMISRYMYVRDMKHKIYSGDVSYIKKVKINIKVTTDLRYSFRVTIHQYRNICALQMIIIQCTAYYSNSCLINI